MTSPFFNQVFYINKISLNDKKIYNTGINPWEFKLCKRIIFKQKKVLRI